jgi:hypothetical protein
LIFESSAKASVWLAQISKGGMVATIPPLLICCR